MQGLLLVASICASLASSRFCEVGPQELWRSRWGVDLQQCYPTWLAKRPGADAIDTVATCNGAEYLHTSPATMNTTQRDTVLETFQGHLFQVGALWDDLDLAFLGGIGGLNLLNLTSGRYRWTNEDPTNSGEVEGVSCDGKLKFRQDMVYTDIGLIVVGFCGPRDNLLFVDLVEPETGVVNQSHAINVSYWEWTGQVRHRAGIAFASDTAYLAAQSEQALHGWLLKLDWSSGVQVSEPKWNVSIVWERVGTSAPTIPSTLRLTYLPDPLSQDDDLLVLLVNGKVLVVPTVQVINLYYAEIPRGANTEWDLVKVPTECRTSGDPNVIVAHSALDVHPLQRVYLSFMRVSGGGTKNVYSTEVYTPIDLVLSRATAAPFKDGCSTGYGVWIAAYSTCDGDNQDACESGAVPTAEVVAFNASLVNESECAACTTSWAGPHCNTHCVCVLGDGSRGACYDGPFHTGSCRCNTNTYSSRCLPCTCVNGVCNEGLNGTGFCTQCLPGDNGTLYWGSNCASSCSCASDERCDGGVFGTGRCTKETPQSRPLAKWKPKDTYLLVGSLVFVALAAPMLCYIFYGHRRTEYQPVNTEDNASDAGSTEVDVPSEGTSAR